MWGLLGASAIEAHHLHSAIGRVKNLPWRVQGELPLRPYLVALVLRLALGVGMAAAFGVSGQAGGPVGVMAVGIAAPKVLEQLAGGRLVERELRGSNLISASTASQPSASEEARAPDGAGSPARSVALRVPEEDVLPDAVSGPGSAAAEGATGEQ